MPVPTVHLHYKLLCTPGIDPAASFLQAQTLYRDAAGINLILASTEILALPELEDLEIGSCLRSDLTDEQQQLFQRRDGLNGGMMQPTDIAVYFVRTTIPPMHGCAAHPVGSPGCVVTANAPLFTLAHELGHVLGLKHVADSDRLMSEWGTDNITNLPPDLIASEVNKILASPLVIQV